MIKKRKNNQEYRRFKMKKRYNEEYEFEIEVIGFLRGDKAGRYCRNGEEIGGKYKLVYGCPLIPKDKAFAQK